MTHKQRRFIDEYLISRNGTEAAIKAGYSEKIAAKSSSENLNKPKIQEAIAARLKELEKPTIATIDEVLEKLTAILRQEATEEVVAVDPIGGRFIKTKKKASLADATKAAKELLGRYLSTKQAKKLELEIERLQKELDSGHTSERLIIVDSFSEEMKGLIDDL